MRRTVVALAAANAIVVLGAVTAVAVPLTTQKTARACVSKHGALALLSHGKCAKGEKSITLNQRGPQGPQGKQGIQGVKGVQGNQGIQGNTGQTGPGATGVVEDIEGSDQPVTKTIPIAGTSFTLYAHCAFDLPTQTTNQFDIEGPAGSSFQVHGLIDVHFTGTPGDATVVDGGIGGQDYPAGADFVGEADDGSYQIGTLSTPGDDTASVVGTVTIFLGSAVFSVNLSTYSSPSECQTVAQAIPSSSS